MNEGLKPERWKTYNVEDEPNKDFWSEIKSKHELKHSDYSHLPNSMEEIRESEKYEVEPLFRAPTIQEKAERFCDELDYQAKDNLSDSEKQQLEDVKTEVKRFAEVFSDYEQ
jgi:hypothetical protein